MGGDGDSSGLQGLWARWVDDSLREGRKDGLTNKGLAAELGIDPTQVTRMRSGERAIKAHELPIIERYLGQAAPGLAEDRSQRVTPHPHVGWASVEAVIAPGVWREAGASMLSGQYLAALPDSDLLGLRQYLCTVESEPRRMIYCVPYDQQRARPQDDDLVHVVRRRDDTEEHTLWLTKIRADGTFILVPEVGSNGQISLPLTDPAIELRGLVVADILRRRPR